MSDQSDNHLNRISDPDNIRDRESTSIVLLSERIRNLTQYMYEADARRHEEIEEMKRQRHNETVDMKNQLKEQILLVKTELEDRVTRDRFRPVEMIAYGIATAVGTAVVFALLGLILIRPDG